MVREMGPWGENARPAERSCLAVLEFPDLAAAIGFDPCETIRSLLRE
jgi:hypothetical protein